MKRPPFHIQKFDDAVAAAGRAMRLDRARTVKTFTGRTPVKALERTRMDYDIAIAAAATEFLKELSK